MTLELSQYLPGMLSGGVVGLTLGILGGGGSILAVPLMVYVAGVADAHVAIGTSAVAVAANAAVNLIAHQRRGNIRWRCALIYSAAGVVGAFAGSALGKALDGQRLLLLFALLMGVVAVMMFITRNREGDPNAACTIANAPKTLAFGAGTGALAGFFGIGGGFLIVPGLMAATGMPLIAAVGSSLVAVTAFGLTTAASYAASGLVDWPLAAVFVAGGALGGFGGAFVASQISRRRGALNMMLATLILGVAAYMAARILVAG